jgi:hypothetical protein
LGKSSKKLDDEILAAREVVDTLGKRKSDVQKAISFAKSQSMAESAALVMVRQLVQDPEAESTGKRGRPKGSKNKGNAHKGGRGVTISEAKQAKIKELAKTRPYRLRDFAKG